MKIKNIIFDWSGVIADDHYEVYCTCMLMFKKLGLKEITYDEFTDGFELPYMNWNRKYHDKPAEEIQPIYNEASEEVSLPKIYPEARGVLLKLKEKGFFLTLFSSNRTERLNREMKSMKLEGIFSNPKSSVSDKVKEIEAWFNSNGFKKDETIYVGDMVHDIHAAKKIGIKVAAITRGYDTREKLAKEEPDWLIDDLRELFEIVENG